MKLTSATSRSGAPCGQDDQGDSRAFSPSIEVTRGSPATFRVQLPVADIDRRHMGRPALQQYLGEAARRGADIERPRAFHIDAETVQPWTSFSAARET
jgi:hypothetical protein